MNKHRVKPANWLENINCAIDGILWTASTQRHMRNHFVAAVLVLLLALFLRISTLEFILLTFAVTLVLFAELFNTALEVVVDLVSPDYHILAKRAKDVAAGGVLVASCGAAVMGFFAFARYLVPPLGQEFGLLGHPPGELAVGAVLVITMLVVLLKARYGHGSPLQGGMPSGHTAVAFSIATSLALSDVGVVLTVLVLVMAAMVSQSRLLLGIHTLREVLAGALLGIGVTLVLYLVFG